MSISSPGRRIRASGWITEHRKSNPRIGKRDGRDQRAPAPGKGLKDTISTLVVLGTGCGLPTNNNHPCTCLRYEVLYFFTKPLLRLVNRGLCGKKRRESKMSNPHVGIQGIDEKWGQGMMHRSLYLSDPKKSTLCSEWQSTSSNR